MDKLKKTEQKLTQKNEELRGDYARLKDDIAGLRSRLKNNGQDFLAISRDIASAITVGNDAAIARHCESQRGNRAAAAALAKQIEGLKERLAPLELRRQTLLEEASELAEAREEELKQAQANRITASELVLARALDRLTEKVSDELAGLNSDAGVSGMPHGPETVQTAVDIGPVGFCGNA